MATQPVAPTRLSGSVRGSVVAVAATPRSVLMRFLAQPVTTTRLSALGRSLAPIMATITPPSVLRHSTTLTLATTTSHWGMVLVLISARAITIYISMTQGWKKSPTQSASARWGRRPLRLSPGLAEQRSLARQSLWMRTANLASHRPRNVLRMRSSL